MKGDLEGIDHLELTDEAVGVNGLPERYRKMIRRSAIKDGEIAVSRTPGRVAADERRRTADAFYLQQRDMREATARQTREVAGCSEIPQGATHRIVSDLFKDQYVKLGDLAGGGTVWAVFIGGSRNGMSIRMKPGELLKADTNLPDVELAERVKKSLVMAHKGVSHAVQSHSSRKR